MANKSSKTSPKEPVKNSRPPIVTILGHVDHGKTSLLDAIRKTHVASKEAGGITQSIGASVITTKQGKQITFIDTPGHAAFKKMRSRGAKVADFAVLLVSAVDGVKPQTKESIQILRESNTPFIVALTKIDLPTANKEATLGSLEKEGVLFEGRGGNTTYIETSSKTLSGINELLEIITLLAEVSDIQSEPKDPLKAVVIESTKNKNNLLVSVVVKNGTLSVGQQITVNNIQTKAKALFDWQSKNIKATPPGYPAQIMGFSTPPPVGSVITEGGSSSSSDIEKQQPADNAITKDKLPVYIKTQTSGSLEAIINALPSGSVSVGASTGEVTQNDVFMAKAAFEKAKETQAEILAFETKASSSISRLAESEGVQITSFNVIYELIEHINKQIEKGTQKILGQAEIVQIYPFNDQKIAGCRVTQGTIRKSDKLQVQRNKKTIGLVKIVSMKKQKQDIQAVAQSEEFGAILTPQLDFTPGDMLVSTDKPAT